MCVPSEFAQVAATDQRHHHHVTSPKTAITASHSCAWPSTMFEGEGAPGDGHQPIATACMPSKSLKQYVLSLSPGFIIETNFQGN